jgi:hypothetical protein
MPGMDGGRVAIELRKTRPEIAILLSSGLEEIPESVLAAVDGIVAKGSPCAALMKEIERVTTTKSRVPEPIPGTDTSRRQHIVQRERQTARRKRWTGQCRRKKSL